MPSNRLSHEWMIGLRSPRKATKTAIEAALNPISFPLRSPIADQPNCNIDSIRNMSEKIEGLLSFILAAPMP